MKIPRELNHDDCVGLLPQYLRGTLNNSEAAAVAAHLEQCHHCREHLQLGRSLHRHFSLQQSILEKLHGQRREQANFERLWARIEAAHISAASTTAELTAPGVATAPAPARRGARKLPSAGGTAALLAALAAASLALLDTARIAAPDPAYGTLSGTTAAGACEHLRVHFIASLQRDDLHQLLGAIHARVLEGPSSQGVYTLTSHAPDQALHQLQLHPAVVQAESTGC